MKNIMKAALLTTSGALAMGLVLPERAAAAQDAEPDSSQAEGRTETIVVTARKSVDTPAEEIKREADGIVDSVTASDIAKTADENLAEALDRVVGVSQNGFFGTAEAGYVSIRGFDSRYNSINIDGNPIWFSSQNNRGAQIGQIPTAVVNEVSVYKTPTADLDGNSIGGHIALRTLRAFDGGTRPYLKAGVRVGPNENGSRVADGPSTQIYTVGKITFGSERQFGAVFGFNRQTIARFDDFGSVLTYRQRVGPDGVERDEIAGNAFGESAFDRDIRNTSIFGKLEVRSEDKLYAFLSGTLFDERRFMYLQRSGFFINQGGTRTVTQTGDGTANFTNAQGQIREFDYDFLRKAKVLGSGLDYRIGEKASIALRANFTDYSNEILTRNAGGGSRVENFAGTYDINGNTPVFTITEEDRYANTANWLFNNVANTSGSAAYFRQWDLFDKVYSAGATLNYNDGKTAEGFGGSTGIKWVRLDRSFNQDFDYRSLPTGVTLRLNQVVPPEATMANNSAALNTNFNAFYDFLQQNGASRIDETPLADYTLREDFTAGFATLRYSSRLLKAFVGLRYERTSVTTETAQSVSGAILPLLREKEYENWLPNVQFTLDPTDRFKIRGAFTKTIGRPDFVDFAPGITQTVNAAGVEIERGSNGDLGPRESTNYDLSAEFYGQDVILSAAVYHKDITGETFNQVTEVFDEMGELTLIRTVPLNNGSASVTGLELSASVRRFEFLPGPLKALSLTTNYTIADLQWDVVFTDGSTRSVSGLRNHPEWQFFIRGGYEIGPLRAYVNYTKRGRAFVEFGATPSQDVSIRPTDQLDLQANLRIMKDLHLTFDARNVTNSYVIEGTGIADALSYSVGPGRSYWVGVRFQL
jgi:TonB-dependent receptor